MTTGTDTVTADSGGLTAGETAFFESGGQTDPGADADAGNDAGKAGDQAQQQGNQVDKLAADTKNNMVPHGALHEERERRKASDKKARDLELENTRFRERFSMLAELNGKGGQQKEAPPDPETDFVGAIKHDRQTLAQIQQQLEKRSKDDEAAGQRSALVRTYASSVAQFETSTTDFRPAYAHLLNSRASELATLGYGPDSIQQQLQDEELAIASIALQNGRNPGEVIYELAKQRGYVKKDAQQQGDATAAKLDTIERGQQANKTLSNAGGASGDLEMTAERLLKMPDTEFLAWIEKNPDKARRLGVA